MNIPGERVKFEDLTPGLQVFTSMTQENIIVNHVGDQMVSFHTRRGSQPIYLTRAAIEQNDWLYHIEQTNDRATELRRIAMQLQEQARGLLEIANQLEETK